MRKFILFTFLLLGIAVTGLAQGRSIISSRSRIGDFFGVPMKPYAGLQLGILSFYGDVKPNSGHNWFTGMPAGKFDFMLEIGEEGMFAGKLSFMYGVFKESQAYPKGEVRVPANIYEGNYTESQDPQYYDLSYYEEGNLNFRANMFNIGLQGEYRIKTIPGFRNIYPYVSTGINIIICNPYADRSYIRNGQPLLYEDARLMGTSPGPTRDNKYETQLKTANIYGQGNISTVTVGFPLELGVDFRVLPTVNIRWGTSFTLTLSDNLDGVSGKVAQAAKSKQQSAIDFGTITGPYDSGENRAARLQTNSTNDFYAYTYIACYIFLPFL